MNTQKRNLSLFWFAVLGGMLVLSTILVYHPAWNGGFIWDDDDYVTKNPLLMAPDGLRRIWFSLDSPSQYFPLVYTAFRIERHLWGLNPTGYHWVNILLHAGNALLLWRLLSRLSVPGAYLAAVIFALHPVQVESVAWISERKNVLMACFFLLTLHAWWTFLSSSGRRAGLFYCLALIAYSAALTAKTTACTLPAALLLILWLKDWPINRVRILQVTPFLLLGLAMGLVTVWWERFHVNTRGALFEMGLVERMLVATRGVWFYLGKLIWPSKLTFIYPQWTISTSNPWAFAGLVGGIALCAAVFALRRYTGRGVEVAGMFFVATLSPLLGFIMLYTFRYTYVADHYQYLACIGPIALFAAAVTQLGRMLGNELRLTALIGFVLACSLGFLTWRQASTYSNVETLWRTTIARNPDCWMAYNNLGIALFEKGKVEDAIAQYEKSLHFRPAYAQTHYNLGTALLERGDIDEAIAQCREALRLQRREPDAHVALGNALLAKKDVDGAIDEYRTALELRPNHADAHYNLGNALMKRGEVDSAVHEFEEAIRFQSDLVEAHIQLADVMTQRADWHDAIVHYERTLELIPNSVATCNNLAWILATCPQDSFRNGPRAVELAEKAQRLSDKESPVVLHTLAAAYAEDRRFNEATRVAEQALGSALREGNSALAADLRREIEIYRSGSPYPAP